MSGPRDMDGHVEPLSEHERAQLLLAQMRGFEKAGVDRLTNADMQRLMEWAERVRFDSVVLELALRGDIAVGPFTGDQDADDPGDFKVYPYTQDGRRPVVERHPSGDGLLLSGTGPKP